ncbi:MAG: hypothetical protein Kow0068_20860 [Marinilabiliales bacterium]
MKKNKKIFVIGSIVALIIIMLLAYLQAKKSNEKSKYWITGLRKLKGYIDSDTEDNPTFANYPSNMQSFIDWFSSYFDNKLPGELPSQYLDRQIDYAIRTRGFLEKLFFPSI